VVFVGPASERDARAMALIAVYEQTLHEAGHMGVHQFPEEGTCGEVRSTWTRFSEAQSPSTFRWSSPRGTTF
jgi:hypothetical protein